MKHKFQDRKDSKSYTHQHDILGGEAVVYRTVQNGDFWQFRCWIKGEKKHFRVSLKTRDLSTAREKARTLYLQLQSQSQNGVKIFGITWTELVGDYLKDQVVRVSTKRITAGRMGTIKSQLKHLLAFVGQDTKVGEIGRGKFLEYAQWRRIENAGVKDVTLRNEQATINNLIKVGNRKGYLPFDAADFEEIRIRGDAIGRRDTFEADEYVKLYTAARSWAANKSIDDEDRRLRQMKEHANRLYRRFDKKWGHLMKKEELERLRFLTVLAPTYQRQFRWDDTRCSELIESLLLGIPIPNIFMATNTDNTWEVVDGLQRLSTVAKFAGSDDLRKRLGLKSNLGSLLLRRSLKRRRASKVILRRPLKG